MSATPNPVVDAALPPYVTPAQVATRLQISVKSIYRLAANDATMPAMRVGKSLRFRVDLLERWLAAHTQRSRRVIADQRDGVTRGSTPTRDPSVTDDGHPSVEGAVGHGRQRADPREVR